MTKRVRVEWLQSHVRNARGILFLLNKLLAKKESFSRCLSGNPIPDGDTFSPQTFCRCLLSSFHSQVPGRWETIFLPVFLQSLQQCDKPFDRAGGESRLSDNILQQPVCWHKWDT